VPLEASSHLELLLCRGYKKPVLTRKDQGICRSQNRNAHVGTPTELKTDKRLTTSGKIEPQCTEWPMGTEYGMMRGGLPTPGARDGGIAAAATGTPLPTSTCGGDGGSGGTVRA